jgi:hypothetical protein
MGWATAWSFDRLRLWLEHGITPERARRNWLAELLVRALVITVAGTALTAEPTLACARRGPGRPRRFDAQMVLSPKGDRILDYLGTHQHLAGELHFSAEPDGSLLIRSGEHRFREGVVDVRVPELVGPRPRPASPTTTRRHASASR